MIALSTYPFHLYPWIGSFSLYFQCTVISNKLVFSEFNPMLYPSCVFFEPLSVHSWAQVPNNSHLSPAKSHPIRATVTQYIHTTVAPRLRHSCATVMHKLHPRIQTLNGLSYIFSPILNPSHKQGTGCLASSFYKLLFVSLL
jgi:hypothetical protein